jgi:hypothetical protein
MRPGEQVLPISRVPEEVGALERAEKRLARVGVNRPESLRLLLGQAKPGHLEKLASNDIEQPDEVERMAGTSIRHCDHDSSSEKKEGRYLQSNSRTFSSSTHALCIRRIAESGWAKFRHT